MNLPAGYTAKSVATIHPTDRQREAGAGDTMWELNRADGSTVTCSGHVARIEAAAAADVHLASMARDREPGGKLDQLKANWENLKRTPCDCSKYAQPIAGPHNRDAHTKAVN